MARLVAAARLAEHGRGRWLLRGRTERTFTARGASGRVVRTLSGANQAGFHGEIGAISPDSSNVKSVQEHRQYGCTAPGSPEGKGSLTPTIVPSAALHVGHVRRSSAASHARSSCVFGASPSAFARPALNASDDSVAAIRWIAPAVFLTAVAESAATAARYRVAKLLATRLALAQSRTASPANAA